MRFEIEELKDKKLLELQEIAQTLEIQKFKQLACSSITRKEDLKTTKLTGGRAN